MFYSRSCVHSIYGLQRIILYHTKVERSHTMRISIESKTRIKMIPENKHEKENLESLWKILIRCETDSSNMPYRPTWLHKMKAFFYTGSVIEGEGALSNDCRFCGCVFFCGQQFFCLRNIVPLIQRFL
jgi:hypothetical protein